MPSERKIITGIPKLISTDNKLIAASIALGITLGNYRSPFTNAVNKFYAPKEIKWQIGRQQALREQLKGFTHHYLVLPRQSYVDGDWDNIHIVDNIFNPDVLIYRRATKNEIISHFLKS